MNIKKMVEAWALQMDMTETQVESITQHIIDLIEAEREACAVVAEATKATVYPSALPLALRPRERLIDDCGTIAAAIRLRS